LPSKAEAIDRVCFADRRRHALQPRAWQGRSGLGDAKLFAASGARLGPYLKKAEGLVDPWGRPYQYRNPGRNGTFEIFTLGRDNAPGGTGEDQDIVN